MGKEALEKLDKAIEQAIANNLKAMGTTDGLVKFNAKECVVAIRKAISEAGYICVGLEPKVIRYAGCVEIPKFTESLDALLRGLVPKGRIIQITFDRVEWRKAISCTMTDEDGGEYEGSAKGDWDNACAPALADAFEQLIDKEIKG